MKLDNEFYKRIRLDIEKYNNDPKMADERVEMIKKAEMDRQEIDDESDRVISTWGYCR